MTNIISSSRYARYSMALAALAMCLMLAPWTATLANAQEAGQTTAGNVREACHCGDLASSSRASAAWRNYHRAAERARGPSGYEWDVGAVAGSSELGAAPFVVQCWTGGVAGGMTPGTSGYHCRSTHPMPVLPVRQCTTTIVMTCGGPGNCTVFSVSSVRSPPKQSLFGREFQ